MWTKKNVKRLLEGLVIASILTVLLAMYNGGITIYAVLSGSMEQAISTGDLVLVNDNNDTVQEQDVIAFRYQTDSIPIVHRVVEIENGEIHTKGDANKTKDFQTVTEDQVIGKVVCAIPLLGFVTVFLKSPQGVAMMLSLLILCVGISIMTKKNRGEENEKSK